MSTQPDIEAPPLVLRVERGNATIEDVTALTALFAAIGGQEQSVTTARQRAGWTSRRRTFNVGAVRGAGWGGGL